MGYIEQYLKTIGERKFLRNEDERIILNDKIHYCDTKTYGLMNRKWTIDIKSTNVNTEYILYDINKPVEASFDEEEFVEKMKKHLGRG